MAYGNPYPYASVPGFPSQTVANYYFANFGYTRIFSPTVLNEFHFVAHRSNDLQDSIPNHQPTGPDLGVQITPDLATGPTNLFFDTGLYIGPSENGPTRYIENTFSWTDGFTWTHGKHNWKFGAGFSPYEENLDYAYYTNGEFDFYSGSLESPGPGSGNPYADFLLGIPDAFYQGPLAASNIRTKSTYVFGQDEWHARKNLVLTLGLRYEYNTPKTDTEGRTFSGRTVAPIRQCAVGDGVSRRPWRPNRIELPGQEKLCSARRLCLGPHRKRQDQFARRLRSFL